MPKAIRLDVKYIDYISAKFCKLAMYSVNLMIGVVMLDAIPRNVLIIPLSWCVLLYSRYSGRTKTKIYSLLTESIRPSGYQYSQSRG